MSRVHLEQAPPPAPSAALRRLVASGTAVTPRSPPRATLVWLIAAALIASAVVSHFGLRADLPGMDATWLGVAFAWSLIVLLGAVIVLPTRGQVLPSIARSRFVAVASVPFLVLVTLALRFDFARTRHFSGLTEVHWAAHCNGLGLAIAAPLVGLAWALVIRRVPVGAPLVGAGLGAAAGALSGLVLHLICPIGGLPHLVGGHVGVVLAGALLGAASSLSNRR